MTNPRSSSRSPDLISLDDFSLEVADDFFPSSGDRCSPFDMGPGAPRLSSTDDSPFDLALSIAEGSGQIFDLTLKESRFSPSPTPEAFLSDGKCLSDEQYPAPQLPFTVISPSSPTVSVDVQNLGATTCVDTTGTIATTKHESGYTPVVPISNTPPKPAISDPKAEAITSGVKIEAFTNNNPSMKAPRVLRRSPRRSTVESTASSTGLPAADTTATGRSGVSTRRTASVSAAAKVGVRGAGSVTIRAIATTGGGNRRVGPGAVKADTATKKVANGTQKAANGTQKAAVVKKKARAERFKHQCQYCGRMFGGEGLKYHLRNHVCLKGRDTSRAVSLILVPDLLRILFVLSAI